MADRFQIPTGIEWISCPATQARLVASLANGTVEEMFQAVLATQSGYRMITSNGVVRVIATTIPPDQNFLLLKVRSFEVRQELVEMAQQQLRNVVQATVVPPKPGGGGLAGSLISNVGEARIDVRVTDATVEDVMNALAIASVKKVWVVTFTESPALTATGFRQTTTLRNSSPVPDDEQPVWETFRWDEPTNALDIKQPK